MAKQLNVFLENRPGRLKSVTDGLCKSQINIIAFTIQDRGDCGLMKLLVDKPEVAKISLSEQGFACALKDIFVVSIKDKCGNLYKLSELLFKHNINVVDAHGFIVEPDKQGICCLELSASADVNIVKIMEKEGFRSLNDEEISELA
jgi:hypothetical protein